MLNEVPEQQLQLCYQDQIFKEVAKANLFNTIPNQNVQRCCRIKTLSMLNATAKVKSQCQSNMVRGAAKVTWSRALPKPNGQGCCQSQMVKVLPKPSFQLCGHSQIVKGCKNKTCNKQKAQWCAIDSLTHRNCINHHQISKLNKKLGQPRNWRWIRWRHGAVAQELKARFQGFQ